MTHAIAPTLPPALRNHIIVGQRAQIATCEAKIAEIRNKQPSPGWVGLTDTARARLITEQEFLITTARDILARIGA